MNITEEMISLADDLTTDICNRIDLLKNLLAEYGEDNYLINMVLDLLTPGYVQYDLGDEQFIYDFNSPGELCSYLTERQKARNNAKDMINAKYGTLGPQDIIYSDTDSFKYAEAKENLGSVYGSCQQPDRHTVKRRTESERKAYIDGFEACAECIEMYLTDEGKQKLDYFLRGLKGEPKIEDAESEVNNNDSI